VVERSTRSWDIGIYFDYDHSQRPIPVGFSFINKKKLWTASWWVYGTSLVKTNLPVQHAGIVGLGDKNISGKMDTHKNSTHHQYLVHHGGYDHDTTKGGKQELVT
jgi:hypothetical protein